MEHDELEIQKNALQFARKNKKAIANRFTDVNAHRKDENPVSVFMAGSPGAGKTEASISLLKKIEKTNKKILRIDPDELRSEFKDYKGGNSWLFQGAVSILVDAIHDSALKRKQSFILDGTLSNLPKARQNIIRSLKRKRKVQILYVYQNPELAWKFVLEREKTEGRNILPKDFIQQYFAAWENVNTLKSEFGRNINVDLLFKEIEGSKRLYKAGIDQIDHHIEQKYNESKIKELIEFEVQD